MRKSESTILDIDMRENNVLQSANTSVDDYINLSRNALLELHEQRSILKRTRTRCALLYELTLRLLDVANSLGLSTNLIRTIERRIFQDKFILYGGMIVTGIIILAIFYYL
jgi:Golgi SNAP receptor complex protein 2